MDHGELARGLKEAENEMEKQTGVKIKIVEKVGTKLVDTKQIHGKDSIVGEQAASSTPPNWRQRKAWSRSARRGTLCTKHGAEHVRKEKWRRSQGRK